MRAVNASRSRSTRAGRQFGRRRLISIDMTSFGEALSRIAPIIRMTADVIYGPAIACIRRGWSAKTSEFDYAAIVERLLSLRQENNEVHGNVLHTCRVTGGPQGCNYTAAAADCSKSRHIS
jgi:hypothetical protein